MVVFVRSQIFCPYSKVFFIIWRGTLCHGYRSRLWLSSLFQTKCVFIVFWFFCSNRTFIMAMGPSRPSTMIQVSSTSLSIATMMETSSPAVELLRRYKHLLIFLLKILPTTGGGITKDVQILVACHKGKPLFPSKTFARFPLPHHFQWLHPS